MIIPLRHLGFFTVAAVSIKLIALKGLILIQVLGQYAIAIDCPQKQDDNTQQRVNTVQRYNDFDCTFTTGA